MLFFCKYGIKINNFEINLSKRLSKFKIYDTIETENKFKIFSDFYLPISFVKKINKEQEKVQKKYSLEEAKTVGIKELQEELDKEIENKAMYFLYLERKSQQHRKCTYRQMPY